MPTAGANNRSPYKLRKLTLDQVKRIDLLLEQVGEFGSVKLVVENGKVKYAELTLSKRL